MFDRLQWLIAWQQCAPADRLQVVADYHAAARLAASEGRFDDCTALLQWARVYHGPPPGLGPVDEIEVDVDLS